MCQIINSRPAGKGQTYGNIYLEVSESTTEEAWNGVYQESLGPVDAFPLAERGKKAAKGDEYKKAYRPDINSGAWILRAGSDGLIFW